MPEFNADKLQSILNGRAPERIMSYPGSRAAVLIPIVMYNGLWQVVFEVRRKDITQGGEICFPGGMLERQETPVEAAVRETTEELLVDKAQITVLGQMNEMTGLGGREITSVLGVIDDFKNKFNKSEVERLILVPLEKLMEEEPEKYETAYVLKPGDDFPYDIIPGGRKYPFRKIPRRHYFYHTKHGVIWGLTAELLYHAILKLREWL